MQDAEGDGGGALVGFVAGDGGSQGVRREDLVWGEQSRRERGLAGAGCADQDDDARVREDQRRHARPVPAR